MNSSHAQISTILTRLTAQRALTNTNITTKTGSRSITPFNVGYSDDSIMAIMYTLAGLTGAAGDLDAVLTLGNRSDLDIEIMKNGVEGEFYTKHMYNGCQTIHNPSGGGSEYEVTFLGRVAGNNVLYLRDAFGFFGYMGSGTLTADRKVLLPDEGDGVGLDATLVTHTTEDAITVTDGTSVGTYDKNLVRIDDGVGDKVDIFPTYVEAEITAGTTTNKIKHHPTKLEYKYTNSVGSISKTTFLNFDRSSFTSGTQNLWMPSANNDTLAVKGDITSFGNFATADLTFTGTRAHHLDRYGVSFDSALMWKIIDTSGNYLLSLNDTAVIASFPMIYASTTPTQKRVKLNAGSNNQISMVRDATQCVMTFTAGSTGSATAQLDSATAKFGVNHLGGMTSAPTIAAGAGAGTSPTVSVGSGSTDLSGYINVTTGTTCTALATVVTITFNTAYAAAPKCIMIQPANGQTRALTPNAKLVYVDQAGITTGTFAITAGGTALSDATAYQWYYTVIQ